VEIIFIREKADRGKNWGVDFLELMFGILFLRGKDLNTFKSTFLV